ncbi:MAG: bifunctional serine/threonine-protein kinase/formylglycine-generating enzyme family protein [Bryobacteraceae bacterium]|jgi:serine/threonine-protein kinase
MQLPARLGKYELQEFLGGGMSHVYRAFDTVIGRTVAVKILVEPAAQDREARERFLAEAQTAAKVTHENVISIYDFGVDPEKGLFMVMEFLQGEDLRHAIKNGHTGDLRSKLQIALQIARALEFIHKNRIIHRDIKPENVHINAAGVVKLMDFGIAKSEDLSRTQPGYVLGTPHYMAPEQVRGETLTGLIDVYAFGVMLFELLTGQKVFVADSVDQIFYSILNVPMNVEPLQHAGVPQPVIQLVAACNAKVAAERPQGFAPIIADLERMIADLSGETQVADRQPASPPPPKIRRSVLVAGLATLLVAIGIGGYFALKPAAAPKVVELAKTISTPTGDMVLVPAGEFRFGQFKQVASLPAFYMDKTEVSNAAYTRFCQAVNKPLPEGFPVNQPNYPVVNVTIRDAREFARWAGKRLPTAMEWEKAARGADGRTFPWGNEIDTSRANTKTDERTPELRPVDSYPSGASPYGALQMVGNAWELVDTPRTAPTDPRTLAALKAKSGEAWYMIRGQSAWVSLVDGAVWDSTAVPEGWKDASVGFRCAKNAQ